MRPGRTWAECVDRLNVSSVSAFVLGVVLLVIFSGVNLTFKGGTDVSQKESRPAQRPQQEQRPNTPQPDGQKGYRPADPPPPPPTPPKKD